MEIEAGVGELQLCTTPNLQTCVFLKPSLTLRTFESHLHAACVSSVQLTHEEVFIGKVKHCKPDLCSISGNTVEKHLFTNV